MKPAFTKKLASIYLACYPYRSVIAIVLIGVLLTAVAVSIQQKYAAQHIDSILELRAKDEAARIQQSVNNIVEIMESIRNFYAASKFVDRDEFNLFVKDQFSNHPEIRALEWAPVVQHDERLVYEKELSQVITGRRITERNAEGMLVDAVTRKEYYPVFYVEPLKGNESALGYDLGSNPIRAQALREAISTGKIAFSDKLQLVQGNGEIDGVLFFQPVYQPSNSAGSAHSSQQKLLGVAVGVLEPDQLIKKSIRNFRPTGLDVLLVNFKDDGQPQILHFHPSRTRATAVQQTGLNELLSTQHYRVVINIPGGDWMLYFKPAPAFYEEQYSAQGWFILLIGLVLTGMLAFNFTKRIRYTQDILHQAQHDALTGLPNRSLFQERLNQALTHARYAAVTSAVLFLDLDNFKHINDSLGHAVGDQLLIEVARRLRENSRSEDAIARMGGDEFILLVQNLPDEQDIVRLAQKILENLTSPYQIGERTFYLSASIGISLFPRDAMDTESLIANADAAMYRAKSRGRNTYDFYSVELTTTSMKRMQLEVELREAVKHGLLDVHYQPLIDLPSGIVIGAEALARWTHSEHGAISPQDFIPVAEESGLIVEIGEWIMRRALQQAKIWIDAGMPLRRMAVNVSAIQLQRSDFVSSIKQILNETGLPAQNFELELTESVIMDQADQVIDTLLALSEIGVTLAIDDFGTGHSSLAYLKRLPLDKLKIDRSFVHDLPDDEEDVAITGAIIALSSSLGLRVTAEGVETREQKDFLQRLGCDEAQGYYFSRPVPAQDFAFSTLDASTQKQTSNNS